MIQLDLDTLSCVLTFCGARELCTLAQTCIAFSSLRQPDFKTLLEKNKLSPAVLVEICWKSLCERRWRIDSNSRILRILGTGKILRKNYFNFFEIDFCNFICL